MCKPQLGLTLTSIAAKFCQTLGYNRLALSDIENDSDRQRKIFMFWQIYIYDRTTALRIGRPPSIPEYDVSTECLDQTSRFSNYEPAVVHLHRFWAHISDVQGAVSSKLYSPVGLKQKPEQRTRLVRALVLKLEAAWKHRRLVGTANVKASVDISDEIQVDGEIKKLYAGLGPDNFAAQCITVGDEIMYYSTLTLVLQANSPAGKPEADAIEAARTCLRSYKTISDANIGNVYTWSSFCHW